jgi:hypothetical protein
MPDDDGRGPEELPEVDDDAYGVQPKSKRDVERARQVVDEAIDPSDERAGERVDRAEGDAQR